MTFLEFKPLYQEAAVALSHPESQEEARVYFSHLRDLSLTGLRAGLNALIQHSSYWPKVAEWRFEAARAEARAAQASQAAMIASYEARREHERFIVCVDCQDTGWIFQNCPETDCGRRHTHGPHRYVVICPCRDTNAAYQASLARERARRGSDPTPEEARKIRERTERAVSDWRRLSGGQP